MFYPYSFRGISRECRGIFSPLHFSSGVSSFRNQPNKWDRSLKVILDRRNGFFVHFFVSFFSFSLFFPSFSPKNFAPAQTSSAISFKEKTGRLNPLENEDVHAIILLRMVNTGGGLIVRISFDFWLDWHGEIWTRLPNKENIFPFSICEPTC